MVFVVAVQHKQKMNIIECVGVCKLIRESYVMNHAHIHSAHFLSSHRSLAFDTYDKLHALHSNNNNSILYNIYNTYCCCKKIMLPLSITGPRSLN